MGTYARILSRMTLDSKPFTAELRRVQREAEATVKKMKSVGRELSLSISAPALAGAAVALNAYKEYDALTRALATQETSVVSLTKRLEELRVIARNPGIGFREAIEGDVRLRAIGISAQQSAKILKEFANTIALTGGGRRELNQVTVQLGQMAAKGQVFAQDLKPIIEAAPAVGNALRNMFGVVDSESIQKILKTAGKSSTDFINDLLDELNKLPRVSGGFKNAVENMEDAIFQFGAAVGEGIDKSFGLSEKLEKLSYTLVAAGESFRQMPPALQKFIVGTGGAAVATGPLLYALGKISELMIGNNGFKQGARILGEFGKGMLQNWRYALKVGVVLALIIENWKEIVAFVGEGVDNFKRIYAESAVFQYVVDKVWSNLKGVGETLIFILGAVGDIAKIVGGVLFTTLRAAGGLLEKIITGKDVKYKDPFKELKAGWDSLIDRADKYRQKILGIATVDDIKAGTEKLKLSANNAKQALEGLLSVGKKTKQPNLGLPDDNSKQSDLEKAMEKLRTGLTSLSRKAEIGVPGFDILEEKINLVKSSISALSEVTGKDGPKAIEFMVQLNDVLKDLTKNLDSRNFAQKVAEVNANVAKIGKVTLGSGKSVIKSTEDQIKALEDAMADLDTTTDQGASQFAIWAAEVDKLRKSLENVTRSGWTVVVDFDGQEKFFDKNNFDITKQVEALRKIASSWFGGDPKTKKKAKSDWDKDVEEITNKVEKITSVAQSVAGSLFGVLDQYYANRYAALDNYYDSERARIESSFLSERAKKDAIQRLDEDTSKKKRKIARDEAKASKAKAIFEATINGITAAVNALKAGPIAGPILAGIIGSLAAAQVALIAATPLPALAKGALAYGPQLALVGDNPGAQTDPEVISPLSRLKSYLKDTSGPQYLYSVVRGNDLWFLSQRNQVINSRIR